jgi:Domain of unknown function (DUF4129)
MKRIRPGGQHRGPFELIEEAFHLLRLAPAATLTSYYLGSLPFILGLLYFWSDMSRGAFAEQRLVAGTVGMTLLFVWMKCWQAIFAQQLKAQLCGEPAPGWKCGRLRRLILAQTILQPAGLFLLSAALVILLPFGWIYAFYQNVTALGGGEEDGLKTVLKKACQQSMLWPLQNHYLLLSLQFFGLFVFLNLFSAALIVPFLFNKLFGVQSAFIQSPWALLNTTFLAAIGGLTYLCVDPILKAVFVLRCFYGESLRSGEDLKAELRTLLPAAASTGVLLCLGFLSLAPLSAAPSPEQAAAPRAVTPNPGRGASSVSADELDRSINEVIHQRKYSWRLPREKGPADQKEKGTLAAFLDGLVDTVKQWSKALAGWLDRMMQRLNRLLRFSPGNGNSGVDWISMMRILFFVLIAAAASTLAVLVFRMWKRGQASLAETASEAILPTPDIANENVGADQLPEDGWLKLARELFGRGELRLALRAFYFASLSHLAERNLITIAKFKSNHDYERELGRRGHALPEVVNTFTQNVSTFDRVWYGLHDVDPEVVDRFASNVQKIKAC